MRPFTLTAPRLRASCVVPVSLPDCLLSTSFMTTSAPRSTSVWLLITMGSSRLARNVCPTVFVSESTESIIRIVMLVPPGIWVTGPAFAAVSAGTGAGAGPEAAEGGGCGGGGGASDGAGALVAAAGVFAGGGGAGAGDGIDWLVDAAVNSRLA